MTAPADSTLLAFAFRDFFEPEVWERLILGAEQVEFPAGAILMRRGEDAPPLYVIDDGTFEVIDARSSPETVLDVLGPGQVMGDMSFIDHAPASAEVRARTHARCFRWSVDALKAQLHEAPELALLFYRALASTVVARARTVMSAAIAGGFGAGAPTRERADAVEHDRAAYALAFDLLDPLSGDASDQRRDADLSAALTATCRWLTVANDAGRAAEVGARLHELLEEVLSSAATAVFMLDRTEGTPAGPGLFRHVLGGAAAGKDPAGLRFDRALLQLPTFRGWRWRDAALAEALAGCLPDRGARVLGVSLSGAPISEAQLGVLRARSGHVTNVQLSPRTLGEQTPSGITRTTVQADLPSLLGGMGPQVGEPHDAVIVDRVCDVVPDEVLRALLRWARRQLKPTGQLLLGHAVPADDGALLEHLLRWPSLPRRATTLVALLPQDGAHTTVAPQDDEAAGLVTWRPRR